MRLCSSGKRNCVHCFTKWCHPKQDAQRRGLGKELQEGDGVRRKRNNKGEKKGTDEFENRSGEEETYEEVSIIKDVSKIWGMCGSYKKNMTKINTNHGCNYAAEGKRVGGFSTTSHTA